jgi:fructokinase
MEKRHISDDIRKVITMGELLIDFIPNEKGLSLSKIDQFIKKPGGAPANVSVAVAKLGGQSMFIGQVGLDGFGNFLVDTMKNYGVDSTNLFQTKEAPTALAFVTLDQLGDREFIFYRNPSADQLLDYRKIDFTKIGNDIFHFCSVSLCDYPIKEAHLQVIKYIRSKKGFISFDPNIRLPLFNDHEAYRKTILTFIPQVDLLKVSDDEIEFLTREKDLSKQIKTLMQGQVKYLILTHGSKGASFYTSDQVFYDPGFKVLVEDTTGAGDAFIGALLFKIAKLDINKVELVKYIPEILKFANAVAALTTTKKGAMNAIPSIDEVNQLLEI